MLTPFDQHLAADLAIMAERRLNAGLVGNRYIDRIHGIAFTVPAGWSIRDRQQVLDAAEGRQVNAYDDAFNEALQSVAADHLPLVAIAAPPWDDPAARLGPHEVSPVIALARSQPPGAASTTFDLWNWVMDDLAMFHANV